jgi:hypothetical protein
LAVRKQRCVDNKTTINILYDQYLYYAIYNHLIFLVLSLKIVLKLKSFTNPQNISTPIRVTLLFFFTGQLVRSQQSKKKRSRDPFVEFARNFEKSLLYENLTGFPEDFV